MRRLLILLTAFSLLAPASVSTALPAPSASADAPADARDIVREDHRFYGIPGGTSFFDSGTDIAFDGTTVYAMEQANSASGTGGIHVFDFDAFRNDPEVESPVVGFVDCPGNQNDVAVVAPGIVAVGFHTEFARCRATGSATPTPAINGVRLFDVSDPQRPVLLGRTPVLEASGQATGSKGTHTLTVHPSGKYIYSSPGGLPTNGGAVQHIIDVSNLKPSGGVYPVHTFQPNATGCHDFEFFKSADDKRDMGVCVGLTESQIWDVSNPISPQIVSRIHNPLIFFHHSGVVTDDGKLLVIGDENFGANECKGGPTGAMFAYDISNPLVPIPRGYFSIDRAFGDAAVNSTTVGASGTGREAWCTAHIYNFIPGTSVMIASWYSGGMNIIDWTDPLAPREVAHYRMNGSYADGTVTNYWSAYWNHADKRIYANDRVRGLDVLRWTKFEERFGDSEPTGAEITEFVRSLPATGSGWGSGRFFDTPTAAQAAYLASRPAPDLAGASAYFCALQ